ncbi:MAG: AAA family ATPase [Turicibacter sp.]|nr:AAA family ATPase [Turicibacter sp.]
MGRYLNPGSGKFQMSLKSAIYVDKSELISHTNQVLDTDDRYICVSRPRRFGKTMAAQMLAAYYGNGEDASEYFNPLNISNHPTYKEHLNQYYCVGINMQDFLTKAKSVENMIEKVCKALIKELTLAHPEVDYLEVGELDQVLDDIYRQTKRKFVILIDEWDCIFRVHKHDLEAQKIYLDFLRLMLKDQEYVGLAYMTGILPIKKYGTHSALNMFTEYSMIDPAQFLDYFGFSTEEVKALCERYDRDFEEVKSWYNGYFVEMEKAIYNPTAVVKSLNMGKIGNYWNSTETYEALRDYIMLDYDGLKVKIIQLIAGEQIPIDITSFKNDMSQFRESDDILSLLIHLGYLAYSPQDETVRIPNNEIKQEFITSIKSLKWTGIVEAIQKSERLLHSI